MDQSVKLVRLAVSTILASIVYVTAGNAGSPQSGSVGEGRLLAYRICAECHGVDRAGSSNNSKAPSFQHIANIPGMTSAALTVALQTSHRSMPNLVIKGRDAQNIIAYIQSLKE